MRAYYFDDLPGDQRLPHDSGIPVDAATLAGIGVIVWKLPVIPDRASDAKNSVDLVAQERGYNTREVMAVSKEILGDRFDSTLAIFYSEHMHEEEEIRCILEGGGYFDFREQPTEKWVRIVVDPGDVVILPTGIYHRFTLDERNEITAMMWFKDRSKWVPHYRSEDTENNPFHLEYLESITVN